MFSILLPELILLILAMLLTAHWANNGLGELRRPLRQLSVFLLDKAPAGVIDMFSKEKGAGAKNWLLFGAIWATIASTVTFLSIWLSYDAKALDSLSGIGWSYDAAVMDRLAEQSLIWGFLGMTLIGAGLHINARANGGGLGSEANASLVAFGWFGLTLASMILPMFIDFTDMFHAVIELAYAGMIGALLLNHLLALGGRGDSPIQVSSWFIIMAHLSMFWALLIRTCNLLISGDLASEMELADLAWFADRVVFGWFPLAMFLAVLYHVIPKVSGAPIWSRSLTLISYSLVFASVPVLGMSETAVSGDVMLTFTAVLTVVGLIPLLAASSNLISTMQGRWEMVVANPGGVTSASATLLLPIFALFGFFSALDALNGSHNMGGVQSTVDHGILWTVGGLVALAIWGSLFPEVVGRRLSSLSKARWAFWLMLLGGIGSTVALLMANFASNTLSDAGVEDASSHLGGYYLTSAALFYGVVIATFIGSINMVATLFSDEVEEDEAPASVGMDSFHLHSGTTSIRNLVSRGVGVDTEIVVSAPEEETEEPSSTDVGVSAALHTDDGVVMPVPEAAPVDPLSSFQSELVDLARWLHETGTTTIDLFMKMDLNSDGLISPFEIREGLASLDIADLPPWDVEKMVSAMDLDGDGKVNIPELDIHMLKIMNSLSKEFSNDGGEETSESLDGGELNKMKKAELVSLADERGVSSSGTKSDIIARLL
ncbi:MAG: hypothetical protein QGF72_00930 [Candidatus Poseidoniaceae archaeon]|nr:hypothetical protein [Candidatus Poseidoniaceae archaeon]